MMGNRLQEAIQKVRISRRAARRYTAVLVVLALLTTLAVNWRLHQVGTALTTDSEYTCGYEEHVHTDECYTEELLCDYEEGEPERIDEAFGVDAEPDAASETEVTVPEEAEAAPEPEADPEPKVEVHHHTADCYREVTELTCEEKEHTHDEACYDTETGELLCTQEEHTHDDSCYTTREELVCGYEEGEEIPVESDEGDVLDTENSVSSSNDTELDEDTASDAVIIPSDDLVVSNPPVHHHTEACYQKVLTCTIPEHVHTLACLADITADVESEDDWEKQSEGLSTFWNDALVEIAQKQLGYTESAKNFTVDEALGENLADAHHYTRYGEWYGNPYGEWDVMFVAFCQHYAGIPKDVIPQCAGLFQLRTELEADHPEYLSDGADKATPGDIIIYNNADGEETIGIVTGADADTLTVISGAVNGAVAEVTVDLTDVTNTISVLDAYEATYGDILPDDDVTDDTVEEPDDDTAVQPDDDAATPVDNTNPATSTELKDYLTSLKVEKRPNSDYGYTEVGEGDTITDGDEIRITMDFDMPNGLADGNRELTYKLPHGIVPSTELNGDLVKSGSTEKIGKYHIDTDGNVTLTFDEKEGTFDPSQKFTGDFFFSAKADISKTDDDHQFKFDGIGTTISVKAKSDLTTAKKLKNESIQYDASGNPYLEYEVTFSTTNGTATDLFISDSFEPSNSPSVKGYVSGSFKLIKKDKDGKEKEQVITPTITNNGSSSTVEVGTVPELKAGESYTLTYKVQLDKDKIEQDGGLIKAKNIAKARYDGDKTSSAEKYKEWKKLVSKEGKYDEASGRIEWTITVNRPDGVLDLKDYVLTDTLENGTINGDVLIYPDWVGNPTGMVKLDNTNGQKTFSYKFPEGSTANTYFIRYYSKIPTDGTTTSVKNTADFTPPDKKFDYKSETDIGVNNRKEATSKQTTAQGLYDGENGLKKADWKITETIASNWDTFTITDIMRTTDGWWPYIDDIHFAYAQELDKLLKENMQFTTIDGTTFKYTDAVQKGLKIDITYYTGTSFDQPGNLSDQKEVRADDATTKVKKFVVKVEKGSYTGSTLKEMTLQYSTLVDVSGVQDGKKIHILNKAGDTEVNYEYTQKDNEPKVTKGSAASSNLYWTDNYKNSGTVVEYKADGTYIHYQVYIDVTHMKDKVPDSITLTDTLDEGLTFFGCYNGSTPYSEKVFVKFAYQGGWRDTTKAPKSWESASDDWKKDVSWDNNQNGHLKVEYKNQTLTMKLVDLPKNLSWTDTEDGNGVVQGIYFYYSVKVDDPTEWDESTGVHEKSYKNSVTFDSETASTDTKVERKNVELQKTGEQIMSNSNYTTQVKYTVEINKYAVDLLPGQDTITLTDNLYDVSPKFKSVKLLRDSVKLYKVNADGSTTEKTDFGFIYDEANYKMTLTIPDNEHLRLEYIYELPTDVDTSISNKVSFEGRGEQSSTIPVYEVTAGGGAQNDQLTITKVDSANQTQGLEDVEFKLTMYDSVIKEWDTAKAKTYTTNDKGQIVLTTTNNDIQVDKLYCLEETKELDGYQKNDEKYYFIWRNSTDLNDESAWKEAVGVSDANDMGNTGVTDRRKVHVFQAHTAQELTVLNTRKLTVKKLWLDKDGDQTTAVSVSSITLYLKKYTGSSKNLTSDPTVKEITLDATNNWTWTYTNSTTDGFTIEPDAHYYIVEATPGEDAPYELVKYSTSNDKGVQHGGLLTVTNRLKENGSYELPSTGGMGTRGYTAVGLLLMGTAFGCLLFDRRKRGGKAE